MIYHYTHKQTQSHDNSSKYVIDIVLVVENNKLKEDTNTIRNAFTMFVQYILQIACHY
jgi:hypothetical protein